MNKNKKSEPSIAGATAFGVAISIFTMLISAGVISTLILNGKMSENSQVIIEPITTALSLFVGAFIIMRSRKDAYFLVSATIAICYLAIAVAINVIMFNADFNAAWMDVLAVLFGVGMSVLINNHIHKSVKRRRKHR